MTFEGFIAALSFANLFVIAGFALLAVYLWRMHVSKTSKFDGEDLFLNDKTRRADLYKLVVAVMAGLAVWTIVTLVNRDKTAEVVTLLPIVLAIFVAGRAVQSRFGAPDPPEPPSPPAPPVV